MLQPAVPTVTLKPTFSGNGSLTENLVHQYIFLFFFSSVGFANLTDISIVLGD